MPPKNAKRRETPQNAQLLPPLDRLRYELELIEEELVALQIAQDAALAQGEDIHGLIRLARQAVALRERRARVHQEIARAERP